MIDTDGLTRWWRSYQSVMPEGSLGVWASMRGLIVLKLTLFKSPYQYIIVYPLQLSLVTGTKNAGIMWR